jgi:hypothetical protein
VTMANAQHFPGSGEDWDAFQRATANSVDGPHRSAFCSHCIRIAETRHQLIKAPHVMERLVEMRHHREGWLAREERE